MKRIICIFILFSISYLLNAQSDSDSLLKIWNDTSIEDTLRADALRGYIYQKHFRSNIDSAILLADEHLAFSKKINNSNTILSSYFFLVAWKKMHLPLILLNLTPKIYEVFHCYNVHLLVLEFFQIF